MVTASEQPSRAPSSPAADRDQARLSAPGLAWIRIRQAVDPLPAGLYRLWQDDAGIGITSRGDRAAAPSAVSDVARDLAQLDLFLLVFAGR